MQSTEGSSDPRRSERVSVPPDPRRANQRRYTPLRRSPASFGSSSHVGVSYAPPLFAAPSLAAAPPRKCLHSGTPSGPSSHHLAQSAARTQAYRFLHRPDWPNPQSQSLFRSYGSNLPTSLTYISLSTRGFLPRRPAADMGTNRPETLSTGVHADRPARAAPNVGTTMHTRTEPAATPGPSRRPTTCYLSRAGDGTRYATRTVTLFGNRVPTPFLQLE